MSRVISRDVFARFDLVREVVNYPKQGCWYCGYLKWAKGLRPHLYRYIIDNDSGRKDPIKGEFCSIECMRAYHA